MTKIYIVTIEPFHDNSTLLGAYPSIDAAERSISPSPDKWSRFVDRDDSLVSQYRPDEGEDDHEIHELVIIDDEIMATVDGKTTVTAPDARTLVLLFNRTRFTAVTHHDSRETASKFARELSSADRRQPDGTFDYRGYLMPDEDAQMRANESPPEVERALYTLRAYAARQRPPIQIARTSPGDAVLGSAVSAPSVLTDPRRFDLVAEAAVAASKRGDHALAHALNEVVVRFVETEASLRRQVAQGAPGAGRSK